MARWKQVIAALVTMVLAPLPLRAAPDGPIVRAGGELLRGAREANGVAVFRGIRYAAPPVGRLRWLAPLPHHPRPGIQDATQFGAVCAQNGAADAWYRRAAVAMGGDPATVQGFARADEDCLFLNVWTPHPGRRVGHGLPVLVWIHGGSNLNGYAYEPNYLGAKMAAKGMVVVSVHYRLGLLGFFAHPALGAAASGRQGLEDQLAALKWLKVNLAAFGGDPARITLAGESAGGGDVAALTHLPQARGTFARAIIESGALAPRAQTDRPHAGALAGKLFAPDITAAALRALTWQQLVALQSERLPGAYYAPVIPPRPAFRVPLLIGSNGSEWRLYQPADPAQRAEAAARAIAALPDPAGARALLAKRLPDPVAADDRVFSAPTFHCPSARLARENAAAGLGAWLYRFDRERPGKHGMGAYHGAEIPYAFDTADPWLTSDAADAELTRITHGYWVNFVRKGDPNGPGLPHWPRWTGAGQIQHLDAPVTTRAFADADLCHLLAPGND